jgi:hypothetical protein
MHAKVMAHSRRWLNARTLVAFGAACALGLLVASCSGKKEESAGKASSAKTETTHEAAPAIDMATAATVSGRVVFEGMAPKPEPIDVSSEAVCHGKSETHPVYTQKVVVNPNNTLRYAFVYVKEGLSGSFPAPTAPVVLDQTGCTYVPHVFGIQAGQPLNIKNSDEGVLHNIHSISTLGNSFNFGMPRVMESVKEFKKAEVMVRIKCDVHGWMSSYAGVLDHPYFGVTGEDGSFKLPPMAPGTYTIEAWHEEYGAQTQTVTVTPSEMKEVTFTYKPTS